MSTDTDDRPPRRYARTGEGVIYRPPVSNRAIPKVLITDLPAVPANPYGARVVVVEELKATSKQWKWLEKTSRRELLSACLVGTVLGPSSKHWKGVSIDSHLVVDFGSDIALVPKTALRLNKR